MLRHAGTIASIVVLFVLVLAGTGIWRWYSTSKNDEARQSLARIVLQTSGPAQVKELAALAEKAPSDVKFSAYLALGQSAMLLGGWRSPKLDYGEADVLLGFEPLETLRALPYLQPGGAIFSSSDALPPLSVSLGKAVYPDMSGKRSSILLRLLPSM